MLSEFLAVTTLVVTDVDEARPFYRDQLGLTRVQPLENAPPVLVSSLQRLGYDMHVFSGPSMSSPEFRSTAFVSMRPRHMSAVSSASTRKPIDTTSIRPVP